jgi:hypothetical protein
LEVCFCFFLVKRYSERLGYPELVYYEKAVS